MNFTLSISPDQYGDNIMESAGFLETLGFGAQMLLLGMVTVFAVLILLWAFLSVFKVVFHGKEATNKVKVSPIPVEQTPVYSKDTDAEIVAVIAAAIAMAESENDGLKFKVVSFRRK